MSALGVLLPAATIGLGSILIAPKRGFLVPGAKPFVAQAVIRERHHDELEITEHPVEQGAPITDHAYKRPEEVIIECGWSASPTPSPSGLLGAALGVASVLGGELVAAAAAGLPTLQAIQSILSGNSTGQPADIYKKLLALQVSRIPFTVLTGKRSYSNMLLKSVSVETDQKTENCLMVVAHCRQVLLVTTTLVSVSTNASVQANPAATAPVINEGPQSLLDASKITPDVTSLSGAVTSLQSTLSQGTGLLNQVAGGVQSLTGAVAGVIGNLPDILGSATSALSDATAGLAGSLALPSFEIPTFANAAQIDIALSPATLTDAMQALPAHLEVVQSQLSEVIVKLPTVAAQLPDVLSPLSTTLNTIQASIRKVVENVSEAMQRAPIGAP